MLQLSRGILKTMDMLREMLEIRQDQAQNRKLNEEYALLKRRFAACLTSATTLVENTGNDLSVSTLDSLDEISKRFDAAKRGLGLVNKLSPGPSKKKHASRILGNLNRIRGLLRRVENQLALES